PERLLQRADLRRASGRLGRSSAGSPSPTQLHAGRGNSLRGGSVASASARTGGRHSLSACRLLVFGRKHSRQAARDPVLQRWPAGIPGKMQGKRRTRVRGIRAELSFAFRPVLDHILRPTSENHSVTMSTQNRQWILNTRPSGRLTGEEFRWNEAPVPQPSDGQVLVRNLWLSVDPAQRTWMARDSYKPAVPFGDVMQYFAVGQV